ncbi:MAG: NAD(P)H-hydrate dehydratase [Rhodobacteraceae bacterium]|nr:NAD(P)H-hydrate dehydratase [Paracoccaceae bacterium]MCY4197427.1 NAD(P)H-hydrate dehydratase [Paracoccaceae bacterium]
MRKLLTSEQMLRLEQSAFESGRVTVRQLMEMAGRNAAQSIDHKMRKPADNPPRAAILCGPGNNGGDGYVVARHLSQLGWDVKVWEMSAGRSGSEAAAMREMWRRDGTCLPLESFTENDAQDITVDALFGIGLSRPLSGTAARAMHIAMRCGRLAAIDIVSGIHSDSGRLTIEGSTDWQPAEITVTFECPKPGHFFGMGGQLTGKLLTVPLGLDAELTRLVASEDVTHIWGVGELPHQFLEKGVFAHKYHHGHVLTMAGAATKGGAARLAARAALRVGAGLVTLASPQNALAEHAAQLNAIMLTACDHPRQLRRRLRDSRINAVCIGPALGTDDRARALVLETLNSQTAIVLDADALTAFSNHPASLFDRLHRNAVLTPHGGEFARLFPHESSWLRSESGTSPVTAVQAAARRAGAVVVLKGAVTIIAAPDGGVGIVPAVGETAAPWLATAGSGDVLAGLIAGLLARGANAVTAASAGVLLHTEAARRFGPGLIAEDLPELLPSVIRTVLAKK